MKVRKIAGSVLVLTGLFFTLGAWGTAQAEERNWEFTVAPYFWMSGLDGKMAAFPPLPPVSVDASFSDVLDALDMAFLVAGEARKGKFALVADIQYYDLGLDGQTPGDLYSGVAVTTKLNLYSLGVAYRMAGDGESFLDGVAALRRVSADNTLSFSEGQLPSVSVSSSESWTDPMLGVKGRTKLAERWYVSGWALLAVGGDSDSAWDAFAAVNYQMTRQWQAHFGYRHMDIDHQEAGFLYDLAQSGPMLGVSYAF